jgi:hypothetical protein
MSMHWWLRYPQGSSPTTLLLILLDRGYGRDRLLVGNSRDE